MAIFRVHKENNYTTIDNNIFKNKELSWKAKGILTTMLSLPNDWEFSVEGLATMSDDKISATRTGIQELEQKGYLKRTRVHDSKGIVRNMIYDIYEKPMCDFPTLEKPTLENQPQLNTNIIKDLNNKKENINNKLFIQKKFKKPTLDEVQEYCRERNNTVDAEYFIDYYESKGWLVGKTKMKDWKAAIRLWERKNNKKVDRQKEIDEMCKRLAYLDEEN